MSKLFKLNITLIIALGLCYYLQSPWYIWILCLLLYSAIIAYAAANIQFNFFIKAINFKQNPSEKTICITFDDGPDPVYTRQILEILEAFNVKASFFLIGKKIANQEALVKQMHNSGHLLGNHSFYHTNTFMMQPKNTIANEIKQTNEAIYTATGRYPLVFRPPFGVTNPRIARAISLLKLHVLGWNVRSLDTKNESPEITLQRIIKKCKPGSVVLLHDTMANTPEVLPKFLLFLSEHQYKVVLPNAMFNINWYREDENH